MKTKTEKTKEILPYRSFMVDEETMGDKLDAVISSIAVTAFEVKTGKILGEFYEKVNMQDCVDLGMTFSVKTIEWWLQQSQEAREEILKDQKTLQQVLTDLIVFIEKFTQIDNPLALRRSVRKSSQYTSEELSRANEQKIIKTHNVALWSNPKEFDLPILQNAYEKSKIIVPWNWRYDKFCVREFCRMAPLVKQNWTYSGIAHNAKIDNRNQISYMHETLKQNPEIYKYFIENFE